MAAPPMKRKEGAYIMKEFAVAIQSLRDLELSRQPWSACTHLNEIERNMQTMFFSVWEQMCGARRQPDRLYFGSEFCQYRLPSLTAVKQALAYSQEHGLAFTFVIPYVHTVKFEALPEILVYLQTMAVKEERPLEVVVNDWGVYHHIRKHFPVLRIVIGRLLNRTIRDPRVADYYADENAPTDARRVFAGSGLLSEWFGRFLQEGNVAGLEFDELIQEHALLEYSSPYMLSFHFPFGCVASGSACMVGFMEAEKKDKFRGDPNCRQQCQRYTFELKNRHIPDMRHRIFQKGNTAFYTHNRDIVKRGLANMAKVESGRVVYSPRIPV
ncbi:hypothetical protein ACH33_09170 [Aneurinibacillus sp. XH2]|nr:hypothetical protein ACH33_09170 [Aneurinibacillus sp. XH2]